MAINVIYRNDEVLDSELEGLAVIANAGKVYQTSDTRTLNFVDSVGNMYECGTEEEASNLPTSGLVLHYDFESVSGNTITDSSPSNNNGTLVGHIIGGGYSGDGVQYINGSDNKITIANALPSTSTFTLCCWIKPDTNSHHFPMFGDIGVGTYFTHVGVGNSIDLEKGGGIGVHFPITPTTAWRHVLLTVNGTSGSLYLDGVLSSSDTSSSNFDLSAITVLSGQNITTNDEGLADDFRVYNRVLTQEEITQLSEVQRFLLDGSTNTAITNDVLSVTTFTDATITAGFGGSSALVDGVRSNQGSGMLGTDNVGFMVRFAVSGLALNKYRLDFDHLPNHWTDWRVFASDTSYNTAGDVIANATLLDTVTGNTLGIGQFTPYFTYTISDYYDYYYIVCDLDSSGTHTRCSEIEFVADLR